jgi:phosphoribosylglycinamide formyltransferase-1
MIPGRPSVCFAGTRLEALTALDRYTNVVTVITPAESRVHRHCAETHRAVEVIAPRRREKAFERLRSQQVDWVFSAGFPLILPPAILGCGPLYLNSHPSLLPSYRGRNAIRDALAAGEKQLGVTVHRMAEDVDAGPVLSRERIWIDALSTEQVYEILFAIVEPLAIMHAIEKLLSHD